jgi:pimeloyl-ACP methyl ester carboxylesterase
MIANLNALLLFFKTHYQSRLGQVEVRPLAVEGVAEAYILHSPLLKPENGPRLFLQREPTKDVLVLTHGLSDSPYYVQAIAEHFYAAGCHVILPLLPAHGLIDPNEAMKDETLNQQWRQTIDHAVETASRLGSRISIGGFSTGGALSLNRLLRAPAMIQGGLFLFSGALSIGGLAEMAGRLSFIQSLTRITDGKIVGIGRDPYKYPLLPSFAGLELVQIIHENNSLSEGRKLGHPVFAAHSVHDSTAQLNGILRFMEEKVVKGVTMVISAQVSHASVPLRREVLLNMEEKLGPEFPPAANPMFEWMMEGAMRFFRAEVRDQE